MTVFFLSAGASLAAPAGLPLFRHLWQAAEIALMSESGAVCNIWLRNRCSAFCGWRGSGSKTFSFDIFSSAEAQPNAVHQVLACRLLHGDIVWTFARSGG